MLMVLSPIFGILDILLFETLTGLTCWQRLVNHMCTCTYVHVHVHVSMHMHMCMHMCTCTDAHNVHVHAACACACASVHVHVHVHVHVCACACGSWCTRFLLPYILVMVGQLVVLYRFKSYGVL